MRRSGLLVGSLALPFVAGALVACLSGRGRAAERPVNGWWQENGSVVPHDTFPADCGLCHTSASWHELRADFRFDHAREAGVVLEGAHARAECLRCHNDRGPVEVFSRQGCAGCHPDPHRGELGRDCAACHDPRDWRPDELLAMHARTRLPLVGAHLTTPCWRCHAGSEVGNFREVAPECVTCHLAEYAATTSPDHEAQGFPTSCEDCHGFVAWDPAFFTHAGIVSGCAECHLDDYRGTTDPDHEAQGFPTSCEDCHVTATWSDAFFNHAGITGGCVDCHLPEYQATSDPDHAAVGFPLQCELCHTPTDWSRADFDHDFPITSGPHAVDCSRCHVQPSNPTDFSCVVCHAHEREEMDDEHRDVGGYVWESHACRDCHPRGREDD